jgi:VanZ family protein
MSAFHEQTRGRTIDIALWTATTIAAGMTAWLSLVVSPPGTNAFSDADKIQHLVAYVVTVSLFMLAAVWRPGRGGGLLWGARAWVLPIAIVGSGAIEVVQGWTGRNQEVADWVAGSVGAAIAVGINAWLRRRG